MSGGFGLPVLDIAGGLAKLGKTYGDAYEDSRRQSVLSALGDAVQGGDLRGAAKVALGAGDLPTGLGLLKLDEAHRKEKLTADADAEFLKGLGGGGGFGINGPVGAPGGGPSPRPAVPSFLDVGNGPQGDYLTGLFRRESNFKTDAQAPTSSARGLGQFTKGTWNQVAAQNPDLGLTPVGNGQDGRTDPDQMIRATKALTATHEGLLQSSGLPVTDATKYALHFLGAGGGRRLVVGALRDPAAPASAYASPEAVAANRNVFFGRDGSPKSTAQVMQDFARSFGGSAGPAPQAVAQLASADPGFMPTAPGPLARSPLQAPARPVQFADDEAGVQRLEQSTGMLPQQAAGLAPPADLPAPGAQNAEFRIPAGAQFSPPASRVIPGSAGALPQGLSGAGDGRGGGLPLPGAPAPIPQRLPPSSSPETGSFPAGTAVPTLPTGPAPARVMAMPGDAPPAQAAPAAIPPDAMIGNVPAQAYTQGPLSQRIPALMKAVANPNLSDGPRQLANVLLKRAFDETSVPEPIKEFQIARANGWTQAKSPADYAREKLRDPGQDLTGQIDARAAAAQRYGMQPGTPEFRDYTLGNRPTRDPGQDLQAQIRTREQEGIRLGMQPGSPELQSYALGNRPAAERQTEAEKIAAGTAARREAAISQGLDPADPRIRDFIISGTLPKENQQVLTAGDRAAINKAEDQALQLDQTIGTLSRAKELNGQTYTGTGAGVLGKTGTSFPGAGLILDPKKAEATREFNQIMSMEAIKSMSATLKGATTDTEMGRFIDILGDPATPPNIRANTIDRMLTLAQRQRDLAQDRYGQMREGTYYRPGGGASASGAGVPQRQGSGGQSGAPALPPPSPSNRPGAVSAGDRFGQLVGSGMSKAQAYERLHAEGY